MHFLRQHKEYHQLQRKEYLPRVHQKAQGQDINEEKRDWPPNWTVAIRRTVLRRPFCLRISAESMLAERRIHRTAHFSEQKQKRKTVRMRPYTFLRFEAFLIDFDNFKSNFRFFWFDLRRNAALTICSKIDAHRPDFLSGQELTQFKSADRMLAINQKPHRA